MKKERKKSKINLLDQNSDNGPPPKQHSLWASALLRVFTPIFIRIQASRLLPESFYKKLQALSVKQKIIMIIGNSSLPIFSILMLVFVVLTYTIFRNMQTDLDTRAIAVRNSWQYFHDQLKVYGDLVSTKSVIQGEMISETPNANRMQKSVKPLLKQFKVSEINIYNTSGLVLVRAHDITNFGQNELKRKYVRQALKKNKSSFVLTKDQTGNKNIIFYITPILFDKENIGAVAVGYYLDHQLMRRLKRNSGTDMFISLNGGVLASSFGEIENIDSAQLDSFLWLTMNFIRKDGSNKRYFLDTQNVDFILKDGSGEEVTLSLVLAVDNFLTKIALLSTVIIALLLTVCAIFISILTAGKVASFVHNAVEDLQDGIVRIIEGDLTYKIPEIAQDEFGELSRSFNQMSVELKTSYENLRKLNDISQKLSSVVKLESLLQMSVAEGLEVAKLDFIAVLFPSVEGQCIIKASMPDMELAGEIVEESQLENYSDIKPVPGSIKIGASKSMDFSSILKLKLYDEGKIAGFLLACRVAVFHEHEMEIIRSIARQIEISMGNIKKLQIQSEIQTASLVQEALIPQEMPNVLGMEVFGTMHPAKSIGGDYFDFIVTNEIDINNQKFASEVWMILGDVSGKGVPAGLIMVMARTFLHSLAGIYNSVKRLLLRLNDFIYENSDKSKFMTGVLTRWDAKTKELRICGAGHESIFIFHRKKNRLREFHVGGTILGIASTVGKDENFKENLIKLFMEYKLILDDGDFVIIFTDGVTEARNMLKEEFGIERVKQFLLENNDQSIKDIIQGLFSEITDFVAGAPQHDDITIMGYKRKLEKVKI
jgi:serine phosphatase RsbU (regulator of sigma subunit)/HAMP domain-containing protein